MLILPYNLKCYVKFKYSENKNLSLVLAVYLSDPKQLLVELYVYCYWDKRVHILLSSHVKVLLTYANNVLSRKPVLSFNYCQKHDLRSTVLKPKSSCFLDRIFL